MKRTLSNSNFSLEFNELTRELRNEQVESIVGGGLLAIPERPDPPVITSLTDVFKNIDLGDLHGDSGGIVPDDSFIRGVAGYAIDFFRDGLDFDGPINTM